MNQDWPTVDPLRAKIMLEDLIGQEQRYLIEKLQQRQMDKYVILLEFAKNKWILGSYEMEVQKETYKENLAWTGISMVGNVGGQLGLWVGFSFTGLLAGTLNVIPKMWGIVFRKI